MDKTAEVFIKLLKCAVTESDEAVDYGGVTYGRLYELSSRHSLGHIMYRELKKRGALPKNEEMRSELEKCYLSTRKHLGNRFLAMNSVEEILEKNEVPFILLKGAFLTRLYPEPWMRSGADVDVLVKPEDLEKASALFTEAGMRKESECGHHYVFIMANDFHVELHFTLIEDERMPSAAKILNRVWDYAVPRDGCVYEHVLKDEIFYFYHIVHMAKHFKSGGCGVRTVLDLWLLNNRMEYDRAKRDELIKKGGMSAFEECAVKLSEIWFSDAPDDGSLDDFAEFILDGGSYGTEKQSTEIRSTKSESKLSYYMKRVFLPYSAIKHSYPILKKAPVLLPVFWVVRWFKLLDPEVNKRTKREMEYVKGTDDETEARINSLFSKLGLE